MCSVLVNVLVMAWRLARTPVRWWARRTRNRREREAVAALDDALAEFARGHPGAMEGGLGVIREEDEEEPGQFDHEEEEVRVPASAPPASTMVLRPRVSTPYYHSLALFPLRDNCLKR